RARSSGRGRPAWLWRPLTAGESSPYAALAGVLAASIARTSPEPSADARRAGTDWGREVAAALPAAPHAAAARPPPPHALPPPCPPPPMPRPRAAPCSR